MSLPKYIINIDEMTSDLKKKLLELVDDEIKFKYPQVNTNDIQCLIQEIKDLLPSNDYEQIKNRMDKLILREVNGIQKIEGVLLDIPPVIQENIRLFKFNKDIYLTGLHFNQTGWKKKDKYNLKIGKNKIINSVSSKEIGEHKYFNTFLKVEADTPISFIFDNLSGNSRQIALDLEFVESSKSTETSIPEKPTIEDIPNDWDIAVVMQWEANSNADIDLHGYIDNMHVCFYKKEYPNFYLNFDFLQHITNKNPEIISVKGYKNKKLDIYVHNYNCGVLNENVNIKIYSKRSYGNKLIKEFNTRIRNNNTYLNGICSINLKTQEVSILEKNINVITGGI